MSDQTARMIISVINMQRLDLYIFLLLGMAVITTTNREDECFYYFIQQPSSHVCCNPWPYIETYSGNALVLHCDLLSPQSNDDIPNVEWYRIPCNGVGSKPQRIHHSKDGKFSIPTPSGDISGGFKRINFTLFVNEVSEADAGCYWCEIKARAGKCSFPMKQSSVFCLHKEMAYGGQENCPILPVNSSVVCASDTGVCGELPTDWLGDPYLITTRSGEPTQVPSPSQPMVPAHPLAIQTNSDVGIMSSVHYKSNSIFSSLSAFHVSQQSPVTSFTTHSIQPTISSSYHQHVSVTGEIPTVISLDSAFKPSSHVPRQNSPSAGNYRTKIVTLLPSSSVHISKSADNKRATVDLSSSVTSLGTGSEIQSNSTKELPLHLTLVQISVFIGIAVCTVLFVVISVLIFGVVMLCKKTTPSTSARTYHMNHDGGGHHTFLNGPAELLSTVWRSELEASPVPTSVVNTEPALPPSSVPSYSSVRIAVTNESDQNPLPQDQPMTSPSLPLTSPMMSVPTHMNAESRWRAYSLPLLSERTGTINCHMNQLRHNQHRLSLERNRESKLDYQQIDMTNAGSVSSPELHYYHVLERPEYYNCIWLEGEDGHELLLGQAKRSNRQRVTIKEDSDSESDSEYHWRVVLTTDQDSDGQDLDRSSSSKRVGRHLYRRLDHSTMEPFQDYATVNIASGNQDSDGSHMHSQ